MLSQSDRAHLSRGTGAHPPPWRAWKGSGICPVSAELSLSQLSSKLPWAKALKHSKKSAVSSSRSANLSVECTSRCFPLGIKQAVPGPGRGITVVPHKMCCGVGSRQQNLVEIEEIPESTFYHSWGVWHGTLHGGFSLSVLAEVKNIVIEIK